VNPLGFVNWRSVQVRFSLLMWLLAGLLAIVILVHTSKATPVHHAKAATARGVIP
jgi:hypothetical protein